MDPSCFSNCSSLNLSTCEILSPERNDVSEVQYDEDGCYNPKDYMAVVNQGDKFQSFSDLLGKIYMINIYYFVLFKHSCHIS